MHMLKRDKKEEEDGKLRGQHFPFFDSADLAETPVFATCFLSGSLRRRRHLPSFAVDLTCFDTFISVFLAAYTDLNLITRVSSNHM